MKIIIDPIISLVFGIIDDSYQPSKNDYFVFYAILICIVLFGLCFYL